MPVEAVKHYKADDGKLYSTYESAQAAQAKWRKNKIASDAYDKQRHRLHTVLGKISQNTSTNALVVQELLMKSDLAMEMRDALNRVVDYHRRKG
jgi:sugar diacid utilization regulator